MNDFENKGTPDQEVPQEPQPAPEEPQQAPAQEEAPQANPYASQVPHLTFDPNEPDPFQETRSTAPSRPARRNRPSQSRNTSSPPRTRATARPRMERPHTARASTSRPSTPSPPAKLLPASIRGAPVQRAPCRLQPEKPPGSRAAGDTACTLGVHNFYLGFTTRGVVQLLVSIIGGVFTCGMATVAIAVWGFVEGVLLLAASPSRMYDGTASSCGTDEHNKKSWQAQCVCQLSFFL